MNPETKEADFSEEYLSTKRAARSDWSGVRLFEFSPTQGYRHKWFTLDALKDVAAPLDEKTLAEVKWVPFSAPAVAAAAAAAEV